MTDRLTTTNAKGEKVFKLFLPKNEIEARQQVVEAFKQACSKLGKIEDIMDKYNVETIQELEKIIAKEKQDKYAYFGQRQTLEPYEVYNKIKAAERLNNTKR